MMTALFAALLLSSASPSATPRLSMELRRPSSAGEAHALEVRFRATGSSDVYFNLRAVRLEIQDSRGDRARYGCADKRDFSPYYSRLGSGETISRWLDARCYHLEPGKRYTISAVFDDGGDDVRGEAPSGAVWVVGPIRSNSIVTQSERPHNKALQTDGASRRR